MWVYGCVCCIISGIFDIDCEYTTVCETEKGQRRAHHPWLTTASNKTKQKTSYGHTDFPSICSWRKCSPPQGPAVVFVTVKWEAGVGGSSQGPGGGAFLLMKGPLSAWMVGRFPPGVGGRLRQLEPGNGSGPQMGLICCLPRGGNSMQKKKPQISRAYRHAVWIGDWCNTDF